MKLGKLFITGLVAAQLLVGCSAASDTGNATSESSGGDVAKKIVVFQSKVEIIDQLEAAAKSYQDETAVEVEVHGTSGDDYFQRLKSELANNQGPTIFSLSPGAEITQLSNYLADLSDLSFAGDIADGMATEVDGKIVGVPYTVEGFGIVYNKNLIDPSAITDYDSFVKMLKDFKDSNLYGFGLSQESYFLIGHILNHPFAVMSDMEGYMEKLAKGEVKMAETPEFQEFAKFYEAIRDNSYNPLEVNYDKECGDFATGKTASIHQGNWSYSMFADYDVDFEMGLMPFPISGNDKLAVSVPTVWSINNQVSESEIKAGKDFLTWLYTSETGKRYVTEEFGFIPVVKGMESTSLDPLSAEVSRYAAEGKTLPWATNLYPAGVVDVHLVPVAQKFFTTDMTAEAFLLELDEAWAVATAS
ncbi:MAG: ABC transporter substrate-binding protein [Clostridiales bacterium]|jgi:raffinose/stachyose/melibiose transport system substrate-binding protein|nr:ABC transporter substrate-binding protein [Clostridiales bacterium]